MKQKLIPKFLTASGYFRYLDDPEFMARMAAKHGTVPGTNTNSGEEQNSKLTTLKKKKDEGTISRGDVVVKARKQGRNLADEKEEINRYLSTQPDAVGRALNTTADALHGIGTVSGLGALGMGLLTAPGATVGGLAGSIFGEKPVDALTNYVVNYNKRRYYPYLSEEDNRTKYTTLTDLISEKTGLSPNMASFFHPGTWIGGSLGARGGLAVQSTVLNVAPRVVQFLASPYTGKWTLFGNREYRFRPGIVASNGVPVDSRPVSLTTERGHLINQQGAVSTNRVRRELALRNALDLYTNENIGEFFPGYGLNITEQHVPGYRPFLGITGPRFGLWALQEDINSKLAERGTEPLRIIEPNGWINREQRSVIIPRSTQRETLAAPPQEIVINAEGLENATTPVRRKTYVDIANGDERLRPDEVFDETGNVRDGFSWRDTYSGWRGTRNWFSSNDDARTRSSKYWDALRNTGRHGRAILSDNPPTISGMRNLMHNGEYSFDSAMLAAKMLGRLYKSGATWHHAKPTFHESAYLLKDGKYYAKANDLGQVNRYTKENFDPELERILMRGNELPQEINVEILSDGSLQYIDSNGRILGTLRRRSNLSIVDQMNTITRGINELYGQQGANIPDSFVDEYGNIWWGLQPGFMLKHGGIVKLLNKK